MNEMREQIEKVIRRHIRMVIYADVILDELSTLFEKKCLQCQKPEPIDEVDLAHLIMEHTCLDTEEADKLAHALSERINGKLYPRSEIDITKPLTHQRREE